MGATPRTTEMVRQVERVGALSIFQRWRQRSNDENLQAMGALPPLSASQGRPRPGSNKHEIVSGNPSGDPQQSSFLTNR